MKFVYAALLGICLTACTERLPSTDPYSTVVEITNMSEKSGGTGVVWASSPTKSLILTNRHMCQFTKELTLVHSRTAGTVTVVSFRVYDKHDLCMITVFADLKGKSSLAPSAPKVGDPIMVLGHPRLMAISKTYGNVSGKMTIAVQDSERDCKPGDNPLLCFIMGGHMPVVHLYEALATSAMISPGSSGSPVYDADDRIVAVMFAGQGDPGYGFAVPYEFVVDFLNDIEHDAIEEQFPDRSVAE